jgi:hypothetical protein
MKSQVNKQNTSEAYTDSGDQNSPVKHEITMLINKILVKHKIIVVIKTAQ